MSDPIILEIIDTPEGVLIHSASNLNAPGPAASVATALCRFADGMFDGGKPVRLDPEIIKAVL